LLDDNRELFIPEQQTHIKPHKNFRIFATQNPASYSGRKTLSRAFRNRFISLSFDDITVEDTMAIMKVRRPILKDSS
jgi:midasin